jgi:hypothetical protein
MLTRFNKILLGVLAVQVVLAVLVLVRKDASAPLKDQPLLSGFDAATVTRIQVFASGKAKPLELAKRGDGWVIASHHDYPAEISKVTDALAPVAKLAAAEPVATSATRHKQLRVADGEYDRKVIVTAGGQDTTLYIGGSAGLRRTAVRLGSDENVWGVTGLSASTFGAEARDWVARNYYEIPRDQITKLEIERAGMKLELERAPAGDADDAAAAPPDPGWKLTIDGKPVTLAADEQLDSFEIDTVISNVALIDAQPADPNRDASKPAATVTVHRKDGADGADGTDVFDVLDADEYYWVKQRGATRATLIDKDRMEAVMEASRAKLVKQEDASEQSITPALPGLPR